MKTVYFVRHGQSVGNLDGVRYGPDTELSSLGHKQARVVANRFADMDIDVILSSPYRRANDTAQYIADVTSAPIEIVDFVRERSHPDSIRGMRIDDRYAVDTIDRVKDSWISGSELPEGAESFDSIMSRVDKLIEFVNNRPEENIVIASHAGFGKQLMLRVLLHDYVTPEIVLDVNERVVTSNTGITTYTISDGWRLVQWNDDAHLGELK